MPTDTATLTDTQLVVLVESLRYERHGLTAQELKSFVKMRVDVTPGAAMRQAKALAETGLLFVGQEDPIGVGKPRVYPADYREEYEARRVRTCTEPPDKVKIEPTPARDVLPFGGVR